MAKKELVSELITNCSCWTEDDREVLNNLSDEKVQTLIDSAKSGKKDAKDAASARKGFEDPQGNIYTLNASGEWELKWGSKPKEEPTSNKETKKQMTEEEWYAIAPSHIQSLIKNMAEKETEFRTSLIEQIVANCDTDEEKSDMRKWLMDVPYKQLEGMAKVASKQKKEEPISNQVSRMASFFGQTGGAPESSEPKKKYEPVPPPVLNFEKITKKTA